MTEVAEIVSNIGNGFNTIYACDHDLQEKRELLNNALKVVKSQQDLLIEHTLSCKAICQLLNITEPTLIKRRNMGLIPFIKLGNNFYYLKPALIRKESIMDNPFDLI